jgi:hypothetical protein
MVLSVVTVSVTRGLQSIVSAAHTFVSIWNDALKLRREMARRHPISE